MKEFRSQHPVRSISVPARKDYRSYRDQLAVDFNNKCGYTDCHHRWFGVKFEVDHFAPQKPDISEEKLSAFTALSAKYENLVYACPQVNRAKSNDWPSEDPSIAVLNNRGYFDPCSDFNEHFYRTDGGGILPKEGDEVAIYMWRKLKLYLRRYEIYWRLELLFQNLRKLQDIRKLLSNEEELNEINAAIADLDSELVNYFEYLGMEHNSVA